MDRGSFNSHQKPKSTNEENAIPDCIITVQWDDGVSDENMETTKRDILLFDNSQIGKYNIYAAFSNFMVVTTI
jgi:hypothetical protein